MPVITLSQLMSRDLVLVAPEISLADAALQMRDKNVSALLAVRDHKPVGILTERDVVRALHDHHQPATLQVGTLMTGVIISARHDTDYHDAYALLEAYGIRHLVVLGDDGAAVGIIAESNILHQLQQEEFVEKRKIREIMSTPVLTLPAHALLAEAVQYMATHHVSCVVAEDDDHRPDGILTERDLVRLFELSEKTGQLTFGEVVSRPVRTVSATMPVAEATRIMDAESIRRLVVVDEDGRILGLVTHHDIVKGMHGEYVKFLRSVVSKQSHRLKKELSEKLVLDNILRSSLDTAIIATDLDFRIIYYNRVAEQLFGYTAEEVTGKTAQEIQARWNIDLTRFERAIEIVRREGEYRAEIIQERPEGSRYIELRLSGLIDDHNEVRGFVLMSRDISARKQAEERVSYLAYFDTLTGLPNRALLHDRVAQAIAAAERENGRVALLAVDLDNFKNVNDSLGHSAGDKLLQAVALRLKSFMREMDTIARQGGDEYIVVLPETGLEGAVHVAQKILSDAVNTYPIEGHDLIVTPSIGISLYPDDGKDFETLLKNADTAMFQAKQGGRNAYQFFKQEMNVAAFERLVLEGSLRQALERNEFVLYYQPQVDIASERIIGAEALIRWRHPQLGMVPPAKFIPVAEDSGLIVPIGEWVLQEACRQNKAWQDAGLSPIPVAVNLSAVQFRQQNLQETVAQVLQKTGLAAAFLELELTERVVMQDAEATILTLRQLHDMGLQLSIDDFGTGYSSLSYLKRFPITKLKIDQSFVRDITLDPDDRAIASAIISMGHSLRLKIIAEGVESAEQFEILREQGCDEVQGYHFGWPSPAAEFARQLKLLD